MCSLCVVILIIAVYVCTAVFQYSIVLSEDYAGRTQHTSYISNDWQSMLPRIVLCTLLGQCVSKRLLLLVWRAVCTEVVFALWGRVGSVPAGKPDLHEIWSWVLGEKF